MTATVPRQVADLLRAGETRLAGVGVAEARADTEVLLAHALGTSRAGLVARAREVVDRAACERFRAAMARRVRREPVFQILGRREFWSLDLLVDRRVLTPRPETEVLVETACRLAPGARTVVDAGTGSGAVALALARELPAAHIVALDREAGALAVAMANRRRLAPRLGLVRADWLTALRDASADLVVANPPYVPDAELAALAPEIRGHEPRAALAGGEDGLREIRRLIADAPRVLRPGGWLMLEIGAGQRPAVTGAMHAAGWAEAIEVVRDLAGVERVVAARRGG